MISKEIVLIGDEPSLSHTNSLSPMLWVTLTKIVNRKIFVHKGGGWERLRWYQAH